MGTTSDLKFGTSGLRGLASILAGRPAFSYTYAFARMLLERGDVAEGDVCLIGRDLRASSPEIARICAAAIAAAGLKPVDCGEVPTPALALAALDAGAPAVMVTGSHIPADRNGLKFYTPKGEIEKADEAAIVALEACVAQDPDQQPAGTVAAPGTLDAMAGYVARYLDFFPQGCLAGLKIGVWQHSSVARDVIVDVLQTLGATVIPLGRSDTFVPIDTEAVSSADREQAAAWAAAHGLDAIVSTDGDADRPLVFDETGAFVEGELLGAITADLLGADTIVTPLTSNSGLEACGRFGSVRRCRVGSPFVIAQMQQEQGGTIVGFEANGGVLLGTDVERAGRRLAALPTRDSLLPILSCLETVARGGQSLSTVAAGFAFKAKAADRLENVSPQAGLSFVASLADGDRSIRPIATARGGIASFDGRDGARMNFADGSVLHFRMSGNAPELRCYAEATTPAEASGLVETGLAFASAAIFRSEVA